MTTSQRPFADPSQLVRSWYVVARSKALKTDRPKTIEVLGKRITLWRPANKPLLAFDARCPHLGADLGQGDIVDGNLRCAFHHWRFDQEGQCTSAPNFAEVPKRCARKWPVRELHGLIWLFNGQGPTFEIPPPPGKNFRRLLLPPQTLCVHPHLVIGNGLDPSHFHALHNMELNQAPRFDHSDDNTLTLHFSARPQSPWMRRLLGLKKRFIEASFTTHGSSIAWATIVSPLPMHTLFAGRPGPNNSAEMQTIFYLPRGLGLRETRAALLMLSLLHRDRPLLEGLDFHRGFTAVDKPFQTFVERVDAMEVDTL